MEELHAPADFPVHELIRRRWSPRAFSDRAVTPQQVRSLLEAARWAPSCFNEQPWSYIVATKDDPAELERMLGVLMEKNRLWARHAPVLMISAAAKNFAHNGKPNRLALHDLGAASACLTMQATAEGLSVHQMAGINLEQAREIYQIPDTHEAVAALAIGYRGDANQLPEEFREKETKRSPRKPQSQFVFAGRFGEAASF